MKMSKKNIVFLGAEFSRQLLKKFNTVINLNKKLLIGPDSGLKYPIQGLTGDARERTGVPYRP